MTTIIERRRMLQAQRLQHRLEIQSRQIERVLARHDMAPTRMGYPDAASRNGRALAGGVVTPRAITFDLQTALAAGWERLRDLTGEMKVALRVPDVSVSRQGGRWQLDVAFKEEPPVPLLDLLAITPDVPPLTAVLGLSPDGRPVLLQFDPKDMTHMLLSGMAGAGKTTLIRAMAVSLALTNRQSQVQLLILSPQMDDRPPAYAELESLNYLPHMLTSVIYDLNTAVETLHFLVNEMAYREENQTAVPHLIVFIEQAAAFMAGGGAPVVDAITHLVQRGDKVGIHLVLSTTEPGAAVFDANLRANLAARVVGQVPDKRAARDAAGSENSGAETLFGRGDFVAITGGRQVSFQAASIGDYDLHLSLSRLRRPPTPTLMAHTYVVRPHLDEIPLAAAPIDRQNVLIFDADGRLWPGSAAGEV
ncbi:MAG: hypothetical protein IPM39_01595 [Chloroflexi bacterium]|nr:hypothetical protein [Chloroflexota bacterium]